MRPDILHRSSRRRRSIRHRRVQPIHGGYYRRRRRRRRRRRGGGGGFLVVVIVVVVVVVVVAKPWKRRVTNDEVTLRITSGSGLFDTSAPPLPNGIESFSLHLVHLQGRRRRRHRRERRSRQRRAKLLALVLVSSMHGLFDRRNPVAVVNFTRPSDNAAESPIIPILVGAAALPGSFY